MTRKSRKKPISKWTLLNSMPTITPTSNKFWKKVAKRREVLFQISQGRYRKICNKKRLS